MGKRTLSCVLHLHQPMFVDGTINGAVNNGTIGRVGNINGFIARSSESKRDRENPSERQSFNLFLRKSEIEQDISNETGNETDHELQDDVEFLQIVMPESLLSLPIVMPDS
ncbi:6474_t:CDS:2 [Acaulospora morrowiae]|uniref:6474_t:CDS:1 n=1 Tax=Acaulospora morrowiae TaxID=94023 RepID=A0A9N9HWG3_9GLOM|nr:6474_t:CDS:2 [Acaulospora morrowiae]